MTKHRESWENTTDVPSTSKQKVEKRSPRLFSRQIFKILKSTNENLRMSKSVMIIMNIFVIGMMRRLASKAGYLARKAGRKTLSASDIQTSCKLLLPREVAKPAVNVGVKAVRKFSLLKNRE